MSTEIERSAGPSRLQRFDDRYPLFTRLARLSIWPVALAAVVQGARLLAEGGGFDAHAYWLAGREPLSYARPPGSVDAFLYSPLFADAVRPIALLPWPAFWLLWTLLEGSLLVWLLRPLPLRWAVPLWLLCVPELAIGNIYILLAATAVVGLRHPAAWSFAVLTKVTVGVGLVWFVVLGRWRLLARTIAVLISVVGVSYLLQPAAWLSWVRFLAENGAGPGGGTVFALRCVAAVALAVVAARRGSPWLVPVAMVVANPLVGWMSLTMLTAIPRLRQPPLERRESRPAVIASAFSEGSADTGRPESARDTAIPPRTA